MLFAVVEKGNKIKMNIKKKLVEILNRFVYDDWYGNDDIAEKLIFNGVTIERHGQWIYNTESGKYVCSACGENALSFRKDTLYDIDLYETCLTDYCPNCGARMDEEAR